MLMLWMWIQGYYQWILHMGGVTHNGLEYTVRHQIRGELDAVGKLVAFRTCQPHYHMYAPPQKAHPCCVLISISLCIGDRA